jgi:uncharacterized protein (DUF1778 family)
MANTRVSNRKKPKPPAAALMVRLDRESKNFLVRAADLRRISISDYVRAVTVAQAKREVLADRQQVIALTPDEQMEFWEALNQRPRLTPAQKELGKVMRGRS